MAPAQKKTVPEDGNAFRAPKKGFNGFSDRGVKKPVRAAYYGKKAR
ncbi:MAG TPA: hypothetical protein PK609_01665 [Candidatus Paceibacterota bacterium]|nr:hypothetical protein [Candidatus Paceibacterota bacterium]